MAEEKISIWQKLDRWAQNFWYHYKYHTIVAAAAVTAIAVALAQCAAKPKYDYRLVIATGSVEMAPSQVDALKNQIAAYCTDQNGDGVLNIQMIECTYDEKTSNYQTIVSKRQKLQSILMNEQDMLLFFTDKTCFDWLDSVRDDGFMENLNLSQKDGRILDLSGTPIFEKAKASVNAGLKWPNELYLSRRIVTGTLIEKNNGVKDSLEKADNLIKKIAENNK